VAGEYPVAIEIFGQGVLNRRVWLHEPTGPYWHYPLMGDQLDPPLNGMMHIQRSEGRLHTLGPTHSMALPDDVRTTRV
jgi:hypothetical protein